MSNLDKEIDRLSIDTAAKLTTRAHEEVKKNPNLRFGQALFNLAALDYPNLATFYTGTGADFYYERESVLVIQMFYEYWVGDE
ncbi:hypothetical protein CHUUTOTORO_01420 [Serratia phage vB_SmaM-ChuuTotoro]|nr:hypothetical protein CHUUTOTORO_01420 [Serratia phage vB_SmaM-ChuuTotoro]